MNYYYADTNNKPVGPIEEQQLNDIFCRGIITLETLVLAEGSSEWKPYRSLHKGGVLPASLPPPISTQQQIMSPPNQPNSNPLAIWSLVLGILSLAGCMFFSGLPAVICGHMARSKVRKTACSGREIALAGLITGYIGLASSILIIPIVAAVAIPNIAGITQHAEITSGKRNAQNLASVSMAAVAAGATREQLGTNLSTAIANLTSGINVTSSGQVVGLFKVDGLPADLSKVTNNLTFDSDTGMLRYTPSEE